VSTRWAWAPGALTAEPQTVTEGSDIPTRALAVVHAARHLVDFRDGLAGALLDLAEVTADQDCPTAAARLARLLVALGPDESWRRGVQITHLAGAVWGMFPDIEPERSGRLAVLRAVCHDTATAVRDALHRDSCVCHSADLQTRITREPPEHYNPAGGIQL
jgi:hypothetical protein